MYFSASLVLPRVDIELYNNGIIYSINYLSTYMYIYLCVKSHVAIEIFYLWTCLYYLCIYIENHAIVDKKKEFQITVTSHIGNINKSFYIIFSVNFINTK